LNKLSEFVYFKGKKEDFILTFTGGEQIFAKDIEYIANFHPHIVEIAIVLIVSSKRNLHLHV